MDSKLHPIAGRHAVQSAAFVINFTTEIEAEKADPRAVKHMQEAALPRFTNATEVQTFTFQMGATSASPQQTPRIGGWQFSIPADAIGPKVNPFRKVLTLQGSQLALVENDYDRWAGFRELVDASLDAVKEVAFPGRRVRDIALAYQDVFVWKGNPREADASTLFLQGAPSLPQNIFSIGSSYFHSNHGYVVDHPDIAGAQLIENVNVARTPGEDFDQFLINTEHRLAFSEPLYDFESTVAAVQEHIDFLHRRNKEKLKEVLLESVQEMIKLGV